jgi:hypothetical protein
MFMNGSPQTRYEIIAKKIAHDDNLLNNAYLCEIAAVALWFPTIGRETVQTFGCRRTGSQRFDLILVAFNASGYDKGARGIHMRLLHQDPPVVMNVKKIRRLMKKFHLKCPSGR